MAGTSARQACDRARRARAILEDELVREAFATLERRILESWSASRPEDWAAREGAYRDLHAARAFRAELERLIRDGQVAGRELEAIEAGRREG